MASSPTLQIAIVGAGFTGLSAAYQLQKNGFQVTVFEALDQPGGLAAGFQTHSWDWSLEKHYHHIFESDKDIQNLIKDLDLDDRLFFKKVRTATRFEGKQFPLDSALTLLQCPVLSPVAKLRTAATLALLKFSPYLSWYESMTAEHFLIKTMGRESWEKIWKPLFEGKFGEYTPVVNAAWFWSRIHVRSNKLGYFKEGFGPLASSIVKKLEGLGVIFHFKTPVSSVKELHSQLEVKFQDKKLHFDKVIVCAPSPVLSVLVPALPPSFTQSLTKLHSLGAITLILEMNREFFIDQTYWLNINEKDWPFLAAVEHTHFAPSEKYNHNTLLYIGKYLKPDTTHFQLTKEELLKKYHPYLEKLSPNYHNHIVGSWMFKERFAQPVVPINHSMHVPSMVTPIKNLYWASMQHVYPWDRGTNYAVRLGKDIAEEIIEHTEGSKSKT